MKRAAFNTMKVIRSLWNAEGYRDDVRPRCGQKSQVITSEFDELRAVYVGFYPHGQWQSMAGDPLNVFLVKVKK